MAFLLRNWRIPAALFLAAVMVIAAYDFARGTATPQMAQASTETALLQAIATQDSTGDGLPDWEKSLYGIPLDASTTDYFHLGMTDGEAVAQGLIVPKASVTLPAVTNAPSDATTTVDGVAAPTPGSLTDLFAQNFFTLYLQAKQAKNGAPLTDQDTSQIAQEAVSELSASLAPPLPYKSAGDLTVQGSGSDALTSYAALAESALHNATSTATKSELLYLQDAIQNNDSSALAQIAAIGASYQKAAQSLSQIPVPQELVDPVLALINSTARISSICADFTQVKNDPIRTMVALQLYPQAVLDFANAFIAINKAYLTEGVTLTPGTPGASFVNLIPNVAAAQQSQTP